jgi:hypothetical protein
MINSKSYSEEMYTKLSCENLSNSIILNHNVPIGSAKGELQMMPLA